VTTAAGGGQVMAGTRHARTARPSSSSTGPSSIRSRRRRELLAPVAVAGHAEDTPRVSAPVFHAAGRSRVLGGALSNTTTSSSAGAWSAIVPLLMYLCTVFSIHIHPRCHKRQSIRVVVMEHTGDQIIIDSSSIYIHGMLHICPASGVADVGRLRTLCSKPSL
jgi:hypothetical protein